MALLAQVFPCHRRYVNCWLIFKPFEGLHLAELLPGRVAAKRNLDSPQDAAHGTHGHHRHRDRSRRFVKAGLFLRSLETAAAPFARLAEFIPFSGPQAAFPSLTSLVNTSINQALLTRFWCCANRTRLGSARRPAGACCHREGDP